MEPEPKSRMPAPMSDEARLAELIKQIRNGVSDAAEELHRIFYPGACFLIRRRMGHSDVDQLAWAVIEAAIGRIRQDKSVEGGNLPGLVRQLLMQRLPASHEGPVPKPAVRNGADRPARAVAEGILDAMSPVERDALRRCYLLGEPPESFLNTLKLTPDQFRALRLRARTEFSTRTSRQTNVA